MSLLPAACQLDLRHDQELSRSECSDGIDNDGDGLIDCEERACRVWSFCWQGGPDAPDAGPQPDAGPPSQSDDAGTGPQPPAPDMDASVPEVDAGRFTPCGVSDTCPDGGTCAAGRCLPHEATLYEVDVLEAFVPRMVDNTCLKTLFFCPPSLPVAECCDDPNPFVEVWLGDELYGKTSTSMGTTMPQWQASEPTALVLAPPGETLTLRVRHEVDETLSLLAFECDIELGLAPGEQADLTCETDLGNTISIADKIGWVAIRLRALP